MVGELPFYRFFLDLRTETGVSLGPSNLVDLQRLILEKYPQEREDMLNLCQILWLQKAKDLETFNRLFEKHWSDLEMALEEKKTLNHSAEEGKTTKKDSSDNQSGPEPATEDSKQQNKQDEETPDTSNLPSANEAGSDQLSPINKEIWLQFNELENTSHKEADHQPTASRDFLEHQFVFTPKYWPIPTRRLEQNWRYLRNKRQKTQGENIDIDATVAKIAKEKFIAQPVYESKYVPHIQEVHVLLDSGGSMTPYKELSEFIRNSIADALKPQKLECFYFRNHPDKKLYQEVGLFKGKSIGTWLRKLHPYSLVVIISDAGAARGGLEPERIQMSKQFLKKIMTQTNRVLWLNPLPKLRWYGNSAFYISLFVTMLAADSEDLMRLPDVLKKW